MTKDRTVALVVSTFDKGGLEQVVYNLYLGYRAAGIPAYVLCRDKGGALAEALPAEDFLSFGGDAGVFFRFCEEKKVTHLHYHYNLSFIESAASHGLYTIYTLHNAYTWFTDEEMRSYSERLSHVDQIVAVSEWVKDYYCRRTGTPEARVEVIENGVDTAELALDQLPESLSRQALGAAPGDVVLTQIGSYCPIKHQFGLIGVMEKLAKEDRRYHLVLAGGLADPNYYGELRQAIEHSSVRDRIHLFVDLPHRSIGALLRESTDVFLLTTQQEGCSNAIIEAMVCGKPIVMTDVGHAARVSQVAAAIVVPPPYEDIMSMHIPEIEQIGRIKNASNRDAICSAVREIAANLDAWNDRAAQSADRADDFSVDVMTLAYLTLIENSDPPPKTAAASDGVAEVNAHKRYLLSAALNSQQAAHKLMTALHESGRYRRRYRRGADDPVGALLARSQELARLLTLACDPKTYDRVRTEQQAQECSEDLYQQIQALLSTSKYRKLRLINGLLSRPTAVFSYLYACLRFLRHDNRLLLTLTANDRLVRAWDLIRQAKQQIAQSMACPVGGGEAYLSRPRAAIDYDPTGATLAGAFTAVPFISVLMPVYNHANVVKGAIDSVLCQDYPNFELVILDDGSTDGLQQILVPYLSDARVRVYRQENQKLPNALTNLHHLAKGDLITWTSADNAMEPQMLTILCNELMQHPEAAVIFGDVRLIDEHGAPFVHPNHRDGNKDTDDPSRMRLFRDARALGYECDNYINACFLYRRTACEALDFLYNPDMYGIEDYDFWLRMQKCGKIIHTLHAQPLYRYRVHRNSISEEMQTTQNEAHIRRSSMLIACEQKRREWSESRFAITTEQADLRAVCARLPVDLSYGGDKNVFLGGTELPKHTKRYLAAAYRADGRYHCCLAHDGFLRERFSIPEGYDISPLALKAREFCDMGIYFYPSGTVRPIGCALPLAGVDADALCTLIAANPGLRFVFADLAGADEQLLERLSVMPNVILMQREAYGTDYVAYASFGALLVPPYSDGCAPSSDRAGALGLACGKWTYYCGEDPALAELPFTERLPQSGRIPDDYADRGFNAPLADRFLACISEQGRVASLLAHINGALQDIETHRPEFAENYPKRSAPTRILP